MKVILQGFEIAQENQQVAGQSQILAEDLE